MIRKMMMAAVALCAAVMAQGQQTAPLQYGADGKFKILQLTDLHYKSGKKESQRALETVRNTIAQERPDLIIITGDINYAEPAEKGFREIMAEVSAFNIPWAVTLGNHDAQFDLSRPATYDLLQSLPANIMPRRTGEVAPDFAFEIRSATDTARVAEVLYLLDSHRHAQVPHSGDYAWLEPEQIQWYRSLSDHYRAANGDQPLPSLMFMHIPLPEMRYALADNQWPRLGTQQEAVCSPDLNSGMFTATRAKGDVNGMFFGHDHDNDVAVRYYDTLLAYGRYGGGDTEYNHLGTSGARVIVLDEATPGEFYTYLRLSDGTMLYPLHFPKDFQK